MLFGARTPIAANSRATRGSSPGAAMAKQSYLIDRAGAAAGLARGEVTRAIYRARRFTVQVAGTVSRFRNESHTRQSSRGARIAAYISGSSMSSFTAIQKWMTPSTGIT